MVDAAKTFNFMRLPYDIRCEIYKLRLTHRRGHVILYNRTKPISGIAWRPCLGVNLLRASKQVYEEAIGFLYAQNCFGIVELVQDGHPKAEQNRGRPYSTEILNLMNSQNRALIRTVEVLLVEPTLLWLNDSVDLAHMLPGLQEVTFCFEWETHFTYDGNVDCTWWLRRIKRAMPTSPKSIRWDLSCSSFHAAPEPPHRWRKRIPQLLRKEFVHHSFDAKTHYWKKEDMEESRYRAALLAARESAVKEQSFWAYYQYSKFRNEGKLGQQSRNEGLFKRVQPQLPHSPASPARSIETGSSPNRTKKFGISPFLKPDHQSSPEDPLADWNDPPISGPSEDSEDEANGFEADDLQPWINLLRSRIRASAAGASPGSTTSTGSNTPY